jgi:hypothetical protein
MFFLTDNPLYIKRVLWHIESKYFQKNQLWEWTMLTAKVTMLILMEIKWTCMHYKPTWQKLKLNFVSVIKCMRVLLTASLYVKLCKMLLSLLFICRWEICFSINVTIANCCSKQPLLYFLTFPKIKEFFCYNLRFKSQNNCGLENNLLVTSSKSLFTIQI